MADAADWVAVSTGIAGLVGGGISAWIAYRARTDARRSADAAESAVALQRRDHHDALAPTKPALIRIVYGDAGEDDDDSWPYWAGGSFEVRRDYRIRVQIRDPDGAWRVIDKPTVADAHARTSVTFAEDWDVRVDDPGVGEMRVDFWPPVAADGVQPWSCDCGTAMTDVEGHWWWKVSVSPA